MQETSDSLSKCNKKLSQCGGVKLIKEVFHWQKEDYQKLDFKINFIYELMEMVEFIKDMNREDFSPWKKIKKEKEECLKTANSHKVLRYLVYKAINFDAL